MTTKKQLNSFLGKENLRYDDADQTRSRFVDVCGALCGAIAGTSREGGIVAGGICGENRVESKDGIELGSRALRSSTRTVSGDCVCIKNVNTQLNAERVAELFTQNLSKNLLTFTQIWGKLYSVESDGAFPKIRNRPEAAPRSHELTASSRAFFLAAPERSNTNEGDYQDGN